MPLLDHFHAPLYPTHSWESFHTSWAVEMMRHLNRRVLPKRYFAETQTHLGGRVEIDVPTYQEESTRVSDSGNGGVAVETWAPPTTALEMPAVFPDEFEVKIFDTTRGGATLVAAVELVSPANKDRPEERRAFAAKCASYLQAGIGLVVVDVVTSYQANLHDELIDQMQQADAFRFPGATPQYTSSYRPMRLKEGDDRIRLWLNALAVGQRLPTVPLALLNGPILPLELELTYTEVREGSRL